MKFDMHCHTKEGSVDAKVGIEAYVKRLMELGFDGMLVTDHNSYKGHDKWQEIREAFEKKAGRSFVVLRGIEYDTRDAGHMLVILPDRIKTRLLEARGMTLNELKKVVHYLGGIIGPAHPYGTGFFALMHTKAGRKNVFSGFDFVEGLNSCSKPHQNRKQHRFARRSGKTVFCGSDSHKLQYVGSAYTIFERTIRNNDDLIRAVRESVKTKRGLVGIEFLQKKHRKFTEDFGILGYYVLNKTMAFVNAVKRKRKMAKIRF